MNSGFLIASLRYLGRLCESVFYPRARFPIGRPRLFPPNPIRYVSVLCISNCLFVCMSVCMYILCLTETVCHNPICDCTLHFKLSVCLYVGLYVYLVSNRDCLPQSDMCLYSAFQIVCLSVCRSVCISCVSVFQIVCLSVCRSVSLYVYLVSLYFKLSVCLFVCMSVCILCLCSSLIRSLQSQCCVCPGHECL